jgi:GT2 family glycosyltransferase
MNTPLISLVVLGYKNFERITRSCVASLAPWLNDPDIEILIVDNGSPDESAQLTAQWCSHYPTVQCLLSDRNRGFAGGMNWGAEHARGEWLLLVNNDTVFPEKALDALKQVVKTAPDDVAMLGPVTNAAGNGQRLWKPGATHEEWLQIGRSLHENPTHELMPTYRCDFFCIAIRRDVWIQLGGLDLDFGLGYYEDFDFSLRLTQAGYRQMITEDVFVLHAGSATFQGSAQARALIKLNKKLLRSKHPDARFEHTRLGNLAVLRVYKNLKDSGNWTRNFQLRANLRSTALQDDGPRSILKKWLWNRKLRQELGI